MKKTIAAVASSLLLLFFCPKGLGQAPGQILLSSSPIYPNLHLAITPVTGWSTEWYRDPGATIVRIFNPASGGREALVIAASHLPAKKVGQSADETYDEVFFHDLSRMLHATVQKRIRTDFWDGAYFEYEIATLTGDSRAQGVQVKNWMMVSDGFLVQFQCYYFTDPSAAEADQTKRILQLDSTYLQLLKSVRKTAEPASKSPHRVY